MNALTTIKEDIAKIEAGWSAQRAVTSRAALILDGARNADALADEIALLQCVESGDYPAAPDGKEHWTLTPDAFAQIAVQSFRRNRDFFPAFGSTVDQAVVEARRVFMDGSITSDQVVCRATNFAMAAE